MFPSMRTYANAQPCYLVNVELYSEEKLSEGVKIFVYR